MNIETKTTGIITNIFIDGKRVGYTVGIGDMWVKMPTKDKAAIKALRAAGYKF